MHDAPRPRGGRRRDEHAVLEMQRTRQAVRQLLACVPTVRCAATWRSRPLQSSSDRSPRLAAIQSRMGNPARCPRDMPALDSSAERSKSIRAAMSTPIKKSTSPASDAMPCSACGGSGDGPPMYRCEIDKVQRDRCYWCHGTGLKNPAPECTLDQAARLVRRLLRSHGEKSSRRSVAARSDAGLWLARFDSQNARHLATAPDEPENKQ